MLEASCRSPQVSNGVTSNVLLKIAKNHEFITFNIRVIPRSSKTEFIGEYEGSLKIKLKSPPVDGAANEELIRFLSKNLDVRKADIEIISGHTSRTKRVRINGLTERDIDRFLQGKS